LKPLIRQQIVGHGRNEGCPVPVCILTAAEPCRGFYIHRNAETGTLGQLIRGSGNPGLAGGVAGMFSLLTGRPEWAHSSVRKASFGSAALDDSLDKARRLRIFIR
jgi:hypothetical protein